MLLLCDILDLRTSWVLFYKQYFRGSHIGKSQRMLSQYLGGQATKSFRPIQRCEYLSFKKLVMMLELCGSAPFCCIHIFWTILRLISSNTSGNSFCKRFKYSAPVTLLSKKCGPPMWPSRMPHHTFTFQRCWLSTWQIQCEFIRE